MRNRITVIAAGAAVTAAVAAGSIGAAVASTTSAKPHSHEKIVARGVKIDGFDDLAARLGVSPARLDQALRAAKISMSKAGANPSQGQFDAALARNLGIPQARVRQAFPALARGSSAAGSKAVGSRAAYPGINAFSAAVARELHVSTARAKEALRPLFAVGRADPSSPAFAAAARSLGVSTGQLLGALRHAKESLAGGK